MASPNIFSQYLQAPRSVNDYMADMDAQDMRREQLAGARQQNALQALAMQDRTEASRLAGDKRNALQQIASGWTPETTMDQRITSLRSNPLTFGEGDSLEKQQTDRRKADADIGKTNAETQAKHLQTLKFLTAGVLSNPTPEAAAMAVDAWERMSGQQSPEIRAQLAQLQTPDQVQRWAQAYAIEADKLLSDETQRRGQAETARHNRTSETLTARGQNLTDTRAREGNDIKRAEVQMGGKPPPGYRWAGDGRLEAIPGGPGDKLPESQQKQVVGTQNLSNAITEYRGELANWSKLKAMSPSARAAMGTKYNNMMLQAKEAYNLGVLNGPDYDILTSVITDPRSFSGAITPNTALDKQASELDRIMGGIAKTSGNRRPQDGAPDVAAGKGSPASAADAFSDPGKEARYQAWKAQQGRQ